MVKSYIRYQVFISSTYDDLRDERESVSWAIMQLGHIPAGMEVLTAKNDRGWDTIKYAIDDSDYYVLILAGRYGTVEEEWGQSWTHHEYEYAVSKGLPVLAFIRNTSSITADQIETNSRSHKLLKTFIDQVRRSHLTKSWSLKADLAAEVTAALIAQINEDLRTGRNKLGWSRGTPLMNHMPLVSFASPLP
ncbi:MAG: DUF4062 domain-containing protein, partial [Blastocatellia bacterium]